jgi:hypothetical protein
MSSDAPPRFGLTELGIDCQVFMVEAQFKYGELFPSAESFCEDYKKTMVRCFDALKGDASSLLRRHHLHQLRSNLFPPVSHPQPFQWSDTRPCNTQDKHLVQHDITCI